MEKVTKKDLLNKDKEIDNKQQMQLELKEIKPIFQIISDLVKAVAYNTTFDEKNNIALLYQKGGRRLNRRELRFEGSTFDKRQCFVP